MSTLSFIITAHAPLAVNERKPGGSQVQEGLDYIPGRVLRGALADLLLRTCTDPLGQQAHTNCPHPAICRALFDGELLFRDARPVGYMAPVTHLLPMTAFSCKDDGGFQTTATNPGHGVFDTLIDRACWEAQASPAFQYQPRCPICGDRTRVFMGAYTLYNIDQQITFYASPKVTKELLTRVAINRRRGVAEDQLLYAVSALSQHTRVGDDYVATRYAGSIWLPESLAADSLLVDALKKHLSQLRHLGSGRSRGLGRVEIENVAASPALAVQQRLQDFNQTFAERWRLAAASSNQQTPPAHHFSVTLQSDAILQAEDGWSPASVLTPASLWAACGLAGTPPSTLTLVRSYATNTTRGGWNALWGLRKETEQVVQAGAVYLFQVDDFTNWAAPLEYLENHGIGVRQAEGFGQVRVCAEFHNITGGKAV